jgi:phytoene dehydrogenase-like protein
VQCGRRVDRVIVRDGRAVGVEVDGELIEARRAVLADVSAPALYTGLVAPEHLPASTRRAITRYEPGPATVKVDWALSSPIPWIDRTVADAGTVHLIDSVDDLASFHADLRAGLLPRHRFLLMGQMTTSDPTRSPAGTETAWAYTHVPQEIRGDAGGDLEPGWSDATTAAYLDRIEQDIERHAPGFRDRIIGRHVLAPPDFQRWNENLIGGDTTGGTNQLHQQLIFRPIPGWARAETPIKGLYLASASAHPGGGVHGAAGANAARAAVAHDRVHRFVAQVSTLGDRLVRRSGDAIEDGSARGPGTV